MKNIYLILTLLFASTVIAQTDSVVVDSTTNSVETVLKQDYGTYPYILPIWGQKAQDRGFGDKLQLPFGFSAMYVNSAMDVEITDFSLEIGNNASVNNLLQQIATVENLNFTQTTATVNGLNFRGDAWLLPFLNAYGMFSVVTGGTTVKLQPTFYTDDENGQPIDTIILPEFGSDVEFNATSYGAGVTLAYAVKNIFISVDGNYTFNNSALLDQTVGLLTLSGRVGPIFKFKNNMRLVFYVGAMYRNFSDLDPNSGSLKFNEALPNLQSTVNDGLENRRDQNQSRINDINDELSSNSGLSIIEKAELNAEKGLLIARNEANSELEKLLDESGVYETEIRYSIKKDLIYPWTFEFGFNWEVNKHWMVRGEYGISKYQRLLLTGVNYRFGIKKRKKNTTSAFLASGRSL